MKLKRKLRSIFDDRFIPRRQHSGWDYSYFYKDKAFESLENTDILTQDVNEHVREKYRQALRHAMGFTTESRLFFPGVKERQLEKSDKTVVWPVKQRRKPIISSPDCALDLPEFKTQYFYQLLDWGSTGFIAAALNCSIFLCNPTTNETVHLTDTDSPRLSRVDGGEYGTAVKWDINGKMLAIGTNRSNVQIWNTNAKKLIADTWCTCVFRNKCKINCLVWSVCNKYLVSGCSRGKLSLILTPDGRVGDFRMAHDGNVIALSCSPDGKYLASTGNDKVVRLWLWPKLQPHFELVYDNPAKAICWHPWKSSILAIGGGVEYGTISIYNANNYKRLAICTPDTRSVVLNLAWSSLTGELVASYWIHEDTSQNSGSGGYSEVLVLSSLNKVVDKFMIGFPTQVICLLWSPDGKRIATASTDETLRIWNFLHIEVKKNLVKPHCKKSCFLPEMCKQLNTSFSKYTVR